MPSLRRQSHSSVEGCCVCGVDRSSQAFVTENEISQQRGVQTDVFQNCFKIQEERSGDLCVDCLAIAKKWIRCSKSSRKKKDYGSVVDSKRSPLWKKRQSRNSSSTQNPSPPKTKRGSSSEMCNQTTPKVESRCDMEVDSSNGDNTIDVCEGKSGSISMSPVMEDMLSEDEADCENSAEMESTVLYDPLCLSPGRPESVSDVFQQDVVSVATQTTFLFPALTSPQANANKLPFIDLSKWRHEDICCGTIFRGPNGEVLVDPKWLRSSCVTCNRSSQPPTPVEKSRPESISVFDEKLTSLCS